MDFLDTQQAFPHLFESNELSDTVARHLLNARVLRFLTCPECDAKQRLELSAPAEVAVLTCQMCHAKLHLDLRIAVDAAIHHAAARSAAYRSAGDRLVRLSERLRSDGHAERTR